MSAFVRASAVLVGGANVSLLAAIWLRLAATGAEELEGLTGYHVFLGLCISTAAGLLVTEVILRVAARPL